MKNFFSSVCLLRVVLPLCLLSCICLRQDLLASLYLVLLLCLPFVPVPTALTMSGKTGCFLKFTIVTSLLELVAQLVFQIWLYFGSGSPLRPCEDKEPLFRQIGFISYLNMKPFFILCHFLPDFLALAVSYLTWVCCKRVGTTADPTDAAEQGVLRTVLSPEDHRDPQVPHTDEQKRSLFLVTTVGKYATLIALCATSVLVPSLTSGLVYLVFIVCITIWAYDAQFGKWFAVVCRMVAAFLAVYIVCIYLYQTQAAQELLSPSSPIARYAGLQMIRVSNCSQGHMGDPRDITFNQDLLWPSFALPFALVFTYFLVIYEARLLFQTAGEFCNAVDCTVPVVPNETTPLIRSRESTCKRSKPSTAMSDIQAGMSLSKLNDRTEEGENGEDRESLGDDNVDNVSLKATVLDYVIDAFITLARFVATTSYIATSIIMMTWSITYVSWLTFVLLMWASILWMVPNQRWTMLKSSPFLVLYAEFLLVSQYVFGMDITREELPDVLGCTALKNLLLQFGWDGVVNALSEVFNYDSLDEIGFFITNYAVKPLFIKTLFTTMFWITLHQYKRESKESKSTSTVAHMMAPVTVSLGPATTMGGAPASKGGQMIRKIGDFVLQLLTKYWIWAVILTLFTIGIAGNKMSLFRIIYTALALVFILVFQISWILWRKLMYGFWITVIFISNVILVMIYTYQFKYIPLLWDKIGFDDKWQEDIGLEKYNTGELFVRLLVPTFVVITTVLQLKYFHVDFLLISDIKSRANSTRRHSDNLHSPASDEAATTSSCNKKDDTSQSTTQSSASATTAKETLPNDDDATSIRSDSSSESFRLLAAITGIKPALRADTFFPQMELIFEKVSQFLWLFAELHIKKLIFCVIMWAAVREVCALNFGFVIIAVLATLTGSNLQDILIRLSSICAATLVLCKMVYQIRFFDDKFWNATCPIGPNQTVTGDNVVWLGFQSTVVTGESMTDFILGYIGIIITVTFYVVIITRQQYFRNLNSGTPVSKPRMLFPNVSCHETPPDLIAFAKYLLNYAFVRLGIEITLTVIVITIGARMNFYAAVYALCVCLIVSNSRHTLSKVWIVFTVFVASLIIIQYAGLVGLPPELCFNIFYTADLIWGNFLRWMNIPVNGRIMDASKLMYDFVVLILASRQASVFYVERHDPSANWNRSIVNEVESPNYENPVPDFYSHKKSWFHVLCHYVLYSMMWVTLGVVFLAGVLKVTIFSLGYLIGCFLFLWYGNDFLLKPLNKMITWWNYLLWYNISVIVFKSFLQVPGCIFVDWMYSNMCWLVQLLGICCINQLNGNAIRPTPPVESICRSTDDDIGLTWDVLCFVCLIFQRRLFVSNYFIRIVDEAKAMAVLADRGAELIEELRQNQILKQREVERLVLEKIKNKMDSIKAAQRKLRGIKDKKGHQSHIEAIRSGDYYMFDDDVEVEELDLIEEKVSEEDEVQDGPTVGKLMSNVLQTSVEAAVKDAKHHRSTSKDESDSEGTSRRARHISDTTTHPTSFDTFSDDASSSNTFWASCWSGFVLYSKFALAFVNSLLISLSVWLNSYSRNHRYVMEALEREKKQLKKSRNFRVGMRIKPRLDWKPMPTPSSKPAEDPSKQQEMFEEEEMNASNEPSFVRFVVSVYYVLMSNSDVVCYIISFVLLMSQPTLLSLPLPLMSFLWGTLTLPRPTKTFWIVMIAYTEIMVVVKTFCILPFFSWNDEALDDKPFHVTRIVGIEHTTYRQTYDLILLIALFLHRSNLKSLGLWTSQDDYEKKSVGLDFTCPPPVKEDDGGEPSSSGSSDPPTDTTTIHLKFSARGDVDGSYENERLIDMRLPMLPTEDAANEDRQSSRGCIRKFFGKLLDTSNRITADVYALMVICDLFNMVIIIFGFSSFGSLGGSGSGVTSPFEYLEQNKVPFTFLIMLLLQFALIIVDRMIYLKKSILGKIIFQYILIIGIHFWLFFLLPYITERQFNSSVPPPLFYFVKSCYLLLSAYQIRKGYPTRVLGNFLTKNYNTFNRVCYMAFTYIPFVYELRVLMDWIWTDTSMTLGDWLKMEDIFSNIFILKCQRKYENKYPMPCGTKISTFKKYLIGGGALVGIILIIWFPLVLFSLSDAVGNANIPVQVALDVRIGSYQPLFETSTYNISSMNQQQFDKLRSLYTSSGSAQIFLSDYKPDDIGIVHFAPYSSSVWTIPPPVRSYLKQNLISDHYDERTKIRMEWRVMRESHTNSPAITRGFNELSLDVNMRRHLYEVLDNKSFSLIVGNLMPKFLRVTNPEVADADPVVELMTDKSDKERNGIVVPHYVNISMKLSENKEGDIMWWSLAELEPKGNEAFLTRLPDNTWTTDASRGNTWSNGMEPVFSNRSSNDIMPINDNETTTVPIRRVSDTANDSDIPLTIYTFNDKAFPKGLLSIISGYGIIGLYTTFVIFVSTFIRGAFSGISYHIMFEEMPNVDRLLQLCLDIYLVRERKEFDLEEDLFAKLLFLYRSPETMVKWTRNPDDGSAGSSSAVTTANTD